MRRIKGNKARKGHGRRTVGKRKRKRRRRRRRAGGIGEGRVERSSERKIKIKHAAFI